ncbi:MAG: hypothetical protein M4579_006621 [Chaenotheca gracillima]|nr:MAG: hypothetical protein M4579_006621 [Chaenotheca gracillima]
MASGSLKELNKALGNALSNPSHSDDELDRVTQAFLDKYHDISDQDSQKLQEDLLQLYQRYVAEDESKRTIFLSSLRRLRPALRGSSRLLEWWPKLLKPCLVSVELKKRVLADVREIVLSILVYDGEEEDNPENAKASALLTHRLMDLYLEKTKLQTGDPEGTGTEQERSKYVSGNIESLLVDFGRKAPKELLAAIDAVVVKKEHRLQALSLLSTLVRHQPPRLYQILQTDLFGHLLKCLLVDTSTTAVSLALTSLVMLLPHIPNSLVPHLPRLFTIYSRVLCWERFRPVGSDETEAREAAQAASHTDSQADGSSSWEKLHYSFDNADSTTPNLSHFFTFLYGLYPLNFMSYIRKPTKYLRDSNAESSLDLDLDHYTIRHRTEQFQAVHLLHPNCYSLTIDTELSDLTRFTKNDPADIVAECMGLRLTFTSARDKPSSPDGRLRTPADAYIPTEDIPTQTLLSNEEGDNQTVHESSLPRVRPNSSWRNTQSTAVGSHSSLIGDDSTGIVRRSSQQSANFPSSRSNGNLSHISSPSSNARDGGGDSPTLPPHLAQSPSEAKLHDMLQTHESVRASVNLSHKNESVNSFSVLDAASPRLDAYIQSLSNSAVPRSPAIHPTVPGPRTNMAFLQREVILLRNELNFERYLKQQHLSHIGQLQRRRIAEATVEAETLNLIHTNRMLKHRLDDAKVSYATLKKETTASKNHSMKWENELNTKYRALREEQKKWKDEEDAIRRELQQMRVERNELRESVIRSDSNDYYSKQRMHIVQQNNDELPRLQKEVDRLNMQLRNLNKTENRLAQSRQQEEAAFAQVQTLQMKLNSRDAEREKMKRAYDHKIAALESHLQSLRSPMPTQAPQALQAMLDRATNESKASYTHLKKVYNYLQEQHTELQMKHIELQAAAETHGLAQHRNGDRHRDRDDIGIRTSSSYGESDNSFPRRFNSIAEGAGYHQRAHSGSHGHHRPGEPLGLSSSAPMTTSFPAPPSRLESLSSYERPLSPNGGSNSYHRDSYLEGLSSPLKQQRSLPDGSGSSNGSTHHPDATSNKPKIKANSEIRVYGRGGVQNIGKKDKKEKEKEKDKDKEGGSKRSLKPGLALAGMRRGFA